MSINDNQKCDVDLTLIVVFCLPNDQSLSIIRVPLGATLVSTWIWKLEVHAEDVATLVNLAANVIDANDANINAPVAVAA